MGERWSVERVIDWQDRCGWLFGCNFTPSTAGNQIEMWSADSFDVETIERELGWARDLGMNVVRVYLHDLLWGDDSAGLIDRVDRFLEIAARFDIRMMPVLFDGVWNPSPALGKQPEPVRGVHNSMWVQSPGSTVLYDESLWDGLRPYVDGMLSRFGDDDRIVMWDLFNEPDQLDLDTIVAGTRDAKQVAATGLVARVFDWARSVNPSQPLTVGLWEYEDDVPVDHELNRLILSRSDVVSFHCYAPEPALRTVIGSLAAHGRPLVCTEWLARSEGSTIDLLEVFKAAGVGAINWGLVDGRTQTRLPWRTWWETVDEDEPWFHELLRVDGSPYDVDEIAVIRSVVDGTNSV